MSSLALTLLYLLAAVLGVVTCRSLKLPPMLGYLAAGVLIGPHAWRWRKTPRACATWASSGWCS
jgi:Kef-type K+ transport system membrane component KefB